MNRKAQFLFVGVVYAHHEEWLGSSKTNLRVRPASDFTSLSNCELMVDEPSHINGGGLDLVLADVSDILRVRDGSSIRTTDHSAIFIDVGLE